MPAMPPASVEQFAARVGVAAARIEQALAWQVVFWSGESDTTEQRRFDDWQAAHPDNQRAWEQVRKLEQALSGLPGGIARDTFKRRDAISRRRALQLLGLGGLGLLTAGGAHYTPTGQRLLADARSGTGEQHHLTLPDGSSLMLNTASAVDLAFDDTRRCVHLCPGSEILLGPVSDPRPFVVRTPAGLIHSDSGKLWLRDHGDRVRVASFDGDAILMPEHGAPLTLRSGEQALMRRDSPGTVTPVDDSALAWTRGLLLAENQRLADFLDELGRYRHGLLRCDPRVADLRLTGTFPLANTDHALDSLAQALPVALRYRTRLLVTVVPV